MQATEAVKQVRNSIFKPGWKFSATYLNESQISVNFTIRTVDTSYVDAAGNFYAAKTIGGEDVTITVTGLDEAGLCYELLKIAMATNFHEDREFMQVRQADGSWIAPLHPHTYQGEKDWQRLGGTKGAVQDDDLDEFSLFMLQMLEMRTAAAR
jgi:hypothetical protein